MDIQLHAPPCVKLGEPLNWCAAARYAEQVLNHITLGGEWKGWKFRGRDLVSPDGKRICPERLRGILFLENIRRVQVTSGPALPAAVIDLGNYRQSSASERTEV